MEAWGGLHNTTVVVGRFMGVKGEEGGWEGELKIRGIAVCVQTLCRACPGNRLPATST